METIESEENEEILIDNDGDSRMSFLEVGDHLQAKANDEESRMSFLESSEADLPSNFFNTQLRSEDEEDKSSRHRRLHFDSDNSVQDPDYEPSISDKAGNSNDKREDELINEAPTTSQRAYSRKISCTRRNLGKTYVNVMGNVVPKRKFSPLVLDCRRKCKTKIPLTLQKSIFQKYWSLGTYNQRILFIGSMIEINNKKTEHLHKHPEKPRDRTFQAAYYVEYEGQRVQVCQKCFLQCFDESVSFVKSVLKKKLNYPQNDFCDQRGSRGGGHNKLTDDKIQLVKSHINSFPNYESHYTRRDTSCKYFHADLTLTQMYKLYCDKYKSEAISISAYTGIFKTMNIKFKKPNLDTCSKCDQLKAKIGIAKHEVDSNLLRDLENELITHQSKADSAYESKRNDKASAANDSTVKVYTFDLQQCLPTPYLRNSISFYKRQLWTYNLTIHDCTTGTPHCFMWHEALSARGGNQIASCLFKHITNLKQVNHAIFYSDSCIGQNKNSFVCAMFILALEINLNLETIDHKFLEPGHTHMECDVDHSVIERKKKRTNAQIHHPHDWYTFVRCAGSKHAFNVVEMNAEDFYNFSLLLKTKLMWRTTNQDGERFIWQNIRWLRYTRTNFAKILFKTTLDIDAPFEILNLSKRGINSIKKDELSMLNEDVKISAKKKKDLLDLLPFINPCFHPFYKSLSTNDTIEIHPDLVEDETHLD